MKTHQAQPRTSKELHEDTEEYQGLLEILKDVFDYIRRKASDRSADLSIGQFT